MGFYGLAGAIFLAAVVGAFSIGFGKGSASRNGEIASLSAAIEVSKRLAAEAERKASEASARVVVEYRDRIKTIREVTPGEIQLVEVVKESNCELPGAWRVLHDSAASGSPAPQDTGGTVSPADAIETVTENYRIARETAARLEALQELVKSQ